MAGSFVDHQALVEQVPAIVYQSEVGVTSDWTYISPQVENVLGFSPQEFSSELWADRVHPDDRDRVFEEERRALRHSPGLPHKSEYRMLRKNGTIAWISDEYVLLDDGAGGRFYRGVMLDITERVEAASQKAALEERLWQAQKLEAVGLLAAGAAHNFNNLLTVINHFARFLRNDLAPGDPRRDDAAEILRAGERGSSLIRQLIAFSRDEAANITSVSVNETVERMAASLRRTLGSSIGLSTALEADLATVEMDPEQTEEILLNLVLNARDALLKQGDRVVIRTSRHTVGVDQDPVAKPGDYVCLAVSDNGCGMTEEVKQRIFEPFFSTKDEASGSGLGLASVYGLAKRYLGHVEVSSEVGRGTSVQVFLPISSAPVPASPRSRLRKRPPNAPAGVQKVG